MLIIDKLKFNILILQVDESTIILDYLGHKCLTIIIEEGKNVNDGSILISLMSLEQWAYDGRIQSAWTQSGWV